MMRGRRCSYTHRPAVAAECAAIGRFSQQKTRENSGILWGNAAKGWPVVLKPQQERPNPAARQPVGRLRVGLAAWEHKSILCDGGCPRPKSFSPFPSRALIARTTSRSEPLASKEVDGWGSSGRVGLPREASYVNAARSSATERGGGLGLRETGETARGLVLLFLLCLSGSLFS